MLVNPLTLHIRLTKHCNADCSYCSSWQESPDARLTPADLRKSIDFILGETQCSSSWATLFPQNNNSVDSVFVE